MSGIKIILKILALIGTTMGFLLHFFSNPVDWHLVAVIWNGTTLCLWFYIASIE